VVSQLSFIRIPLLFFVLQDPFTPALMKTVSKDGVTSVVAQNEVIIPDLTVKDLLSAVPFVPPLLTTLVLR
jgi:hypothetical protein